MRCMTRLHRHLTGNDLCRCFVVRTCALPAWLYMSIDCFLHFFLGSIGRALLACVVMQARFESIRQRICKLPHRALQEQTQLSLLNTPGTAAAVLIGLCCIYLLSQDRSLETW